MAGRILLVEDEADIRAEIAEFLVDKGYAVDVAASGAEALEKLRAGDAPCVILLDLMMPRMDGWAFRAEQLKLEEPRLATIPVVLLSGAREVAEAAATLAAAAFLVKPFDAERLLATVRRYC